MNKFWIKTTILWPFLLSTNALMADIVCEKNQRLLIRGDEELGYSVAAFSALPNHSVTLRLNKVFEFSDCTFGKDRVFTVTSIENESGVLKLSVKKDHCSRNGCYPGEVKASLVIDHVRWEFAGCRKIRT